MLCLIIKGWIRLGPAEPTVCDRGGLLQRVPQHGRAGQERLRCREVERETVGRPDEAGVHRHVGEKGGGRGPHRQPEDSPHSPAARVDASHGGGTQGQGERLVSGVATRTVGAAGKGSFKFQKLPFMSNSKLSPGKLVQC